MQGLKGPEGLLLESAYGHRNQSILINRETGCAALFAPNKKDDGTTRYAHQVRPPDS